MYLLFKLSISFPFSIYSRNLNIDFAFQTIRLRKAVLNTVTPIRLFFNVDPKDYVPLFDEGGGGGGVAVKPTSTN